MSDIRVAVRTLRKHPGSTIVVVLTLAVAIGATTAIYSAIDAVQHFIPIVKRDGLVYATSTDSRVIQTAAGARSAVMRTPVSIPDLADWTARSSTFEEFAGFAMSAANLTGISLPMRVSVIRVTTNLGDLWGFTPALGRGFRADEGQAGAGRVALLSYGFWQRQFGTSPAVLGQSLLLDGVAHTIVGVFPPQAGTGLFRDVDLFTPLVIDPLRGARGDRTVFVTGRLQPGIALEQASAELEAVARQLQAEHPGTNERIGAAVLPLIEASGFNVRILLGLLGFIALLVLVVASANVANITIAQSVARRHEFAVRAALGATRIDRISQLMTESALVSAAAAVVGLELAVWGIDGLRWLGSDSFGFAEIHMNWRVVAAGLVAAFAAPLGFGLLPALGMAAPDGLELRDGGRTAGASPRGRRARSTIVALQAAAAMILMVQVGLLVRTTWHLSRIVPGFDPERVLTFRIGLSGERYAQREAIGRFTAELTQLVGALPGVASLGIVDRLPIADREAEARLTLEGTEAVPLEQRPLVARAAIGGEYLATMRIPVTRGRGFSNPEMTDASPVALVSEEAAHRFWPAGDPIGARIALDSIPGQETWLQIVGVVGNLRNSDVDQGPRPEVYVSTSWRPAREMAVVVKSAGQDPLQLVPAIRERVARIDRDQPIHDIYTMSRVLFDDLAGTYVLVTLLGAIGLIALCLSAAGIYGIVSYSAVQRRREIGVRLALGAQPREIVRMIVAYGARPVAAGGLVGLAGAMAIAVAIAGAMPEIDARDPINYIGVMVTIAAVTFIASYLPARRAASINPVVTLRQE